MLRKQRQSATSGGQSASRRTELIKASELSRKWLALGCRLPNAPASRLSRLSRRRQAGGGLTRTASRTDSCLLKSIAAAVAAAQVTWELNSPISEQIALQPPQVGTDSFGHPRSQNKPERRQWLRHKTGLSRWNKLIAATSFKATALLLRLHTTNTFSILQFWLRRFLPIKCRRLPRKTHLVVS